MPTTRARRLSDVYRIYGKLRGTKESRPIGLTSVLKFSNYSPDLRQFVHVRSTNGYDSDDNNVMISFAFDLICD